MSADISTPQSVNNGSAGSPADPASWQYVRDLPMPPEVAQLLEAEDRERDWWWRWWNRRLRDGHAQDLKLQYYFGGKIVALLWTERGVAVVAVGDDLDSPAIVNLRERFPELHRRAALEYLPLWNDNDTRI